MPRSNTQTGPTPRVGAMPEPKQRHPSVPAPEMQTYFGAEDVEEPVDPGAASSVDLEDVGGHG